MSSREIAELCEARHNDVVATIQRLFDQGVLRESRNTLRPFAPEGGGRPTQVYDLTKRDTLVVVSGYNAELRAKIIDRWQELEERAARPTIGSAAQAEISRERRLTMDQSLRLAKMAGLTGNQAVISANQITTAMTGIDTLGLMGITHMTAPTNDNLLTPTEIARRLGYRSPRQVNQVFCERGYQQAFRDSKAHIYYELTDAGRRAGGVMQDTGKRHSSGTPVRQLKWASSILDELEV